MKYFLLSLFVLLPLSVSAQVVGEDAVKRMELSKQLHEIKPIKPRIDRSIDQIASHLKQADQRTFAVTVKRILNYKAIETASIKAMAEIYTVPELEAMIEYYSKPEARSAAEKQDEYQDRLSPEITKMMDQALMEMRTGGSGF